MDSGVVIKGCVNRCVVVEPAVGLAVVEYAAMAREVYIPGKYAGVIGVRLGRKNGVDTDDCISLLDNEIQAFNNARDAVVAVFVTSLDGVGFYSVIYGFDYRSQVLELAYSIVALMDMYIEVAPLVLGSIHIDRHTCLARIVPAGCVVLHTAVLLLAKSVETYAGLQLVTSILRVIVCRCVEYVVRHFAVGIKAVATHKIIHKRHVPSWLDVLSVYYLDLIVFVERTAIAKQGVRLECLVEPVRVQLFAEYGMHIVLPIHCQRQTKGRDIKKPLSNNIVRIKRQVALPECTEIDIIQSIH